MVGADTEAPPISTRQELSRQVPVPEMPCDTDKCGDIVRPDFDQRLGGRIDADNAAVIEDQTMARPKW